MCQLSAIGGQAQATELQFHNGRTTTRSACCVGIIYGINGNGRKVDVTPSLLFNLTVPPQRIKIIYASIQKSRSIFKDFALNKLAERISSLLPFTSPFLSYYTTDRFP